MTKVWENVSADLFLIPEFSSYTTNSLFYKIQCFALLQQTNHDTLCTDQNVHSVNIFSKTGKHGVLIFIIF